MASELFRAVQAAEERAEQLVQEAQREAREQIKATEAQVTQQERELALEHRAMYQSLLEARRNQLQSAIECNVPAQRAARQQMLDQARANLNQAVGLIVERVWNDGTR